MWLWASAQKRTRLTDSTKRLFSGDNPNRVVPFCFVPLFSTKFVNTLVVSVLVKEWL